MGPRKSGAQQAGPWDFVRDGSALADPNHIITENYHFAEEQEQRYLAIGMTRNLVLVVVVFVERSEPAVEIIHIISARKAVAYEQSIYQDQIG